MTALTFLIVDDEPLAHRVIENFTTDMPQLQKVGNCYDALEAATFLRNEPVGLLFLDIQMPKIKGLDFLRSLRNPPQVIVTSAYREYALEGYELNIVDYLLKPFSLPRFLQAIDKVTFPGQTSSPGDQRLFLKADKQYHQVNIQDIRYVAAYGNYLKVFLSSGKMLVINDTLSRFCKTLPPNRLLRIHKSYAVAIEHINTVEGNQIWVGEQALPVGATYRDAVKALL